MKRNGFTLIEIMVATMIVAMLSIIGVVSYNSVNKRSRDAKRKSDLEQVRSALEMYRTDNGWYPGSSQVFIPLTDLSSSLVPTYLPSIPADPKGTTYYYSPVQGASANIYQYCVCASVEAEAVKNDCSTLGVSPPGAIVDTAYCLKNP